MVGISDCPFFLNDFRKEKINNMNTFTVNGTEYKAKPFDFNLVCDLEDMGVSLEEMGNKKMSMVRSYFALCAEKSNEFAGKELNAHFVGGGKFEDIVEVMSKEMEISDFFQALTKTTKTEAATNETTKSEED